MLHLKWVWAMNSVIRLCEGHEMRSALLCLNVLCMRMASFCRWMFSSDPLPAWSGQKDGHYLFHFWSAHRPLLISSVSLRILISLNLNGSSSATNGVHKYFEREREREIEGMRNKDKQKWMFHSSRFQWFQTSTKIDRLLVREYQLNVPVSI